MKSKQTLALLALAAASAISANATLFVQTGTSGTAAADAGVTTAHNPGPFSITFQVNSNGTLDSLGVFDHNGDGFAGLDGSFTWSVNLWSRDTPSGSSGTLIAGVNIDGTDTLVGGVWRSESFAGVSLSTGVTYAITVERSDGIGLGLYSNGATEFNGWSDTAADANLQPAVYSSDINVLRIGNRGAGAPFAAFNIFDATGPYRLDTTELRVVTANFTPVPEPETYALIAGAGLVGFGLWRRRATKA